MIRKNELKSYLDGTSIIIHHILISAALIRWILEPLHTIIQFF